MIRDDSRARLGYLLLLEPPEHSSIPVLRTLFRDVAGDGPNYRFLPVDEMLEVLAAPTESAQDLFLGGCHDEVTDSIVLVRGNFKRSVVPLSSFREDSDVRPDPHQLGFADCGQTVTLGDYQGASDAILYELDAEFRRRLNARRHCEQQGLGPSLRRLRKQLGLTRGDFGEISVKTIARIERGETQPSRRTRKIIEGRVGMEFEEILTF